MSQGGSLHSDHLSDESIECVASFSSCPKSSYIPSQEEIVELMRQIPPFTKRETLVQNMGVLFSTTQRIPIEIESNPNQSFMARLPFGTLDTIISRIMCMQDYTTFEMAKVVSYFPFLFILP